jgi:CubicO group peptidase (beta-lactamase class C family)
MTKAIASVAAMQLVEQGKLTLDEPVPARVDPALASPQVLEGFDTSGQPRLRPAKRPITLKHLLTHTAGFSYDIWDASTGRYAKVMSMPHRSTGKVASLRTPLLFDPGDRWTYGVNTDWVGRTVEAVSGQSIEDYFRERIFGPLGMKDSGYVTTPEQRARQARLHTRQADGSLAVQPLEPVPVKAEFWSAGGPLYSTARDYLTFVQMLLGGGRFNGQRILKPETVALMNQNHTGSIPCGVMKAELKNLSYDVDLFPGQELRWGLGYMLNLQPGPNGRSAGTVSWGGIFNTYYWIDPARRVTGVIMTQILPFADPRALRLYGQFERAVYAAIA